MSQVIVIPFNGQEIGQGFNSETGESIGTGLSVANIGERKDISSGTSSAKNTGISSTSYTAAGQASNKRR